jgi:hypothetical protein
MTKKNDSCIIMHKSYIWNTIILLKITRNQIIMKMFWKIILLLIVYQQMLLAIPITMINNAIFNPIDTNYWLANLSNITSCDSCVCQCYASSSCVTANYYGHRQECILFSASLGQGQLHLMTISENTTVISFKNRSHVGEWL